MDQPGAGPNGRSAVAPKASCRRWKTSCSSCSSIRRPSPANHAWPAMRAEPTPDQLLDSSLATRRTTRLSRADMAPERDASRVATSHLALEDFRWGPDGTERRRQRPTDACQQLRTTAGRRKPIRIRTCSWSMNIRAKWSIGAHCGRENARQESGRRGPARLPGQCHPRQGHRLSGL